MSTSATRIEIIRSAERILSRVFGLDLGIENFRAFRAVRGEGEEKER
ncbi:MAG: hypothetical protein OCU12_06710 [Methanophagales archaeon]|nr:hypothetical protein [Methanophagales archaeon]